MLILSTVRFGYTNETYNNPQNLWIYSLVACFSAARKLLKTSTHIVPRGCSSPCSVATRLFGSYQLYIRPATAKFPLYRTHLGYFVEFIHYRLALSKCGMGVKPGPYGNPFPEVVKVV